MENEKTAKKFEEPKVEIVRLTETDVIATSGGDYLEDCEGEIIPIIPIR